MEGSLKLNLNDNNTWVVAYIEPKFLDNVENDLLKNDKYRGIVAYIPTVKILRKKFKNKDEFEYIPLLFNYGFFSIPHKSINVEFLNQLKEDIQCIYSWVKDPIKLVADKPKIRVLKSLTNEADKLEIQALPEFLPYAFATDHEIDNVIKAHSTQQIYSKDELDNLKTGSIITLKGYPFDDMNAEVIEINHNTKKVKVKLMMETMMKAVIVSFDNVFYSIYQGGFDNKPMREQSIEDIRSKGNKNSMDKIYKKNEI